MKAHLDWNDFIGEETKKDYYLKIKSELTEEMKSYEVYPPIEDWFNSLSISPYKSKVIIIGQDPYHNKGQAHGYSFSVKKGVRPPPSLQNIYKEIEKEFQIKMPKNNGDLTPWVNQGVILLNAILTVRANNAASHKHLGWENFTNAIIKSLSDNLENRVFMLWGSFAKNKSVLIDSHKHLILNSPHPSPFSAHSGFFGNEHFKKANEYLISHRIEPIDWKIEE